MNNFIDSAIFFRDFEKPVNELKAAGGKVSEREKMNYMLRTLLESMSHIGDLIDVLKEEDQTVEYIKSKIKMMDLKNKQEDEGAKSNAFITERK